MTEATTLDPARDLSDTKERELDQLLERSRYRGAQVAWDDVIGHEGAKRELKIVAATVNRHAVAERLGLVIVKGVIVMGPPGSGKTMLAKALANAVERAVYVIPAAEVDATLIRRIYERLADTPCVLVWDEADLILRTRSSSRATDSGRTVGALCSALDGVQSITAPITVALTAESEYSLDASALRAGRLTTKIELELPTRDDRLRIFRMATKDLPVNGPIDHERAADRSASMSGADIVATVMVAIGLGLVDGIEALDPKRLDEALARRHHVDERPIATSAQLERTALHESGHVVAGALLWGADALSSTGVSPASGRDGATTFVEEYQSTSRMTRTVMRQAVSVALAGMVAEELILGPDEVSGGCSSDLTRATRLVRTLVTDLGASRLVGPIDVDVIESGSYSDRGPESMRSAIWHAISGELAAHLDDVRTLLRGRVPQISGLAALLLAADDRTLSGPDLRSAIREIGVGSAGPHDPDRLHKPEFLEGAPR